VTQTTVITAGDNLYMGFDIRDRVGAEITASTLSDEEMNEINMNYVLTAPHNFWGGTEVFNGAQSYKDGEAFKINFQPIRAGKNTMNPRLKGQTLSCANCNFYVKHGPYDWQRSVLQPWNEETKRWHNNTIYEIRQRYEWYPRFRFILRDAYDNRVTT